MYATVLHPPAVVDEFDYECGVVAALAHWCDPDGDAHIRVEDWPALSFLQENFPVRLEGCATVHLGGQLVHTLTGRVATARDSIDFLRGYAHGVLASDWGMQDRGTVYAYTYPHYLHHAYDEDTGRTLIKVGSTHRSAAGRVAEQTRMTPCPEPGILLRSWTTRRTASTERLLHALLEAGGDMRSQGHPGSEWFLTRLDRLDHAAELLGLRPDG